MIQRTTQDFVVTQIHFLLQICSTFYRALDKGWVPGFLTLAAMTLIPSCQSYSVGNMEEKITKRKFLAVQFSVY